MFFSTRRFIGPQSNAPITHAKQQQKMRRERNNWTRLMWVVPHTAPFQRPCACVWVSVAMSLPTFIWRVKTHKMPNICAKSTCFRQIGSISQHPTEQRRNQLNYFVFFRVVNGPLRKSTMSVWMAMTITMIIIIIIYQRTQHKRNENFATKTNAVLAYSGHSQNQRHKQQQQKKEKGNGWCSLGAHCSQ